MHETPVMDRLITRTLDREVPLNVHIDVTYRCNEKCIHCYLDHEDHGELTSEEIYRVLDQLAETGTLFLTLSGGEIFLRPDFFEILAYARKLRFDLNLKTNGILITDAKAARLKGLAVRMVQISIYSSDPAVHDAITKVPGSLARSLEAVKLLKKHGVKVKIACPLMRQNVGGYKEVQELAARMEIPYMLDLTITPRMDGDLGLLKLRNSAEHLLPVLKDPIINQPTAETGKKGCHADAEDAWDGIPCSAGMNSAYITPYGDVYPCVQLPLPTGNIRRQHFRDIWHKSAEMRRVRGIREDQLRICTECDIRQYCERCPGLAYMENGDLLGPSERACELAEMKARLAGVANPVSAFHLLGPAQHAPVGNLIQIAPVAAG